MEKDRVFIIAELSANHNNDYDLDQSEDDKESDDEDEFDELDDADDEEIDGEIDLEEHEALYGPAPSIFDRIF